MFNVSGDTVVCSVFPRRTSRDVFTVTAMLEKMKETKGTDRAEDNNEGSQGDGNEPTLVWHSGRIRKGRADPSDVAMQIDGITGNRGRRG